MAGKLTLNTIQLGDSVTPTQNFVIQTNIDGTAKIARGVFGSTSQDIMSINVDGSVTFPNGINLQNNFTIPRMVLGTAKATTSGTSIDFTDVPVWAKKITLMLAGVSTNGASILKIQLGSTTFQTTGYLSAGSVVSSFVATTISTSGFITSGGNVDSAATVRQGSILLNNMTGNTWIMNGNFSASSDTASRIGSGSVTLTGVIDRIRLTTVNGTDIFDAGLVNVLYEG